MFRSARAGVLVVFAAATASCGGGGDSSATPTAPTPTVTKVLTSITVTGGSTVNAGASLQLTATPKDQNGAAMTAAVTWTSSAGAATVNSAGLVSGVAAGSTTITATSGAISGSLGITVTNVAFATNVDVNATASSTFSPQSVDIARNGTVNFVFGSLTHNVVFNTSGAPANIGSSTSTTVSRSFPTAGTFPYDCTLHSGMSGTVIVH